MTEKLTKAVVDADLELRLGEEGVIYLPCWLLSLQSFLLVLPKIRGGEQSPPQDLPLQGEMFSAKHSWELEINSPELTELLTTTQLNTFG